jgi:hypothetical protein
MLREGVRSCKRAAVKDSQPSTCSKTMYRPFHACVEDKRTSPLAARRSCHTLAMCACVRGCVCVCESVLCVCESATLHSSKGVLKHPQIRFL